MQAVKFADYSRSRTAMPLIFLPGARAPGISAPYKNQFVQHLGVRTTIGQLRLRLAARSLTIFAPRSPASWRAKGL